MRGILLLIHIPRYRIQASGGFYYVAAQHESFPHALELSKKGYNAFVLIYRPDDPYSDLARALCFIEDHAGDLNVNPYGYSLWGGSAGARMAAVCGNADYLRQLTGRNVLRWNESPVNSTHELPQASAVIMQYTGYDTVSSAGAPTYACVGTYDGIADYRGMQQRANMLKRIGIPAECHVYRGLSHGFGLGTGTVAEGWIRDAEAFWDQQSRSHFSF